MEGNCPEKQQHCALDGGARAGCTRSAGEETCGAERAIAVAVWAVKWVWSANLGAELFVE